jgi:hypothetical protein
MNLGREHACDGKRAHRTRGRARRAMRQLRAQGVKRLNVYPCPHQPHWHVGHLPYDTPEPTP